MHPIIKWLLYVVMAGAFFGSIIRFTEMHPIGMIPFVALWIWFAWRSWGNIKKEQEG